MVSCLLHSRSITSRLIISRDSFPELTERDFHICSLFDLVGVRPVKILIKITPTNLRQLSLPTLTTDILLDAFAHTSIFRYISNQNFHSD